VQDEIGGTVAQALKVALSADTAHAERHQSNTEAYNLLLEGDFFVKRATKADTEKAIGLYKQAIKLDPNYALAWASLGRAYIHLLLFGMEGSESIAEDIAKARDAVDQALRIDPDLPLAYRVRGSILYVFDWNWRGAEAAFAQARELDPGNAVPDAQLGQIAMAFGRLDEAIEPSRRNVAQNPLSAEAVFFLGFQLFAADRYEEAAGTLR